METATVTVGTAVVVGPELLTGPHRGADGLATMLSQRQRYRVRRYDSVWCISDHQGYIEIASGDP